MLTGITEILRINNNLFVTDFLDILIVAFVIYSIFMFLRRTRSYLVFFGLAIAGGLYLISKIFNLYLTFITLRYFVGVAVVIFVIVFQIEIRKYLEFLGLIGTRRIKSTKLAPRSPTTSEIIEACIKMAKEKIGALIVLKGDDDIDSLIDGGKTLDGIISEEILLSLFDPSSDGHDGAVIIRNNRISKFGAHLPLSTNFKEIGKHGTRHSAALGLAENSDALCIVVSEEKGKISIAQNGKLKKLQQFEDLDKELTKYIKHKFELRKDNRPLSFVKNNWHFKLGAIVLATLLWFFTAYKAGITEKTYKVPLNILNIPENTLIEDYSPKEIAITVSGRGERIFEGIDGNDFKITLDAAKLESGVNKKNIEKKSILVPTNLTLVKFEPEAVLLTSTKFKTANVPIAVKVTGELQEEIELKSIVSNPEGIEILVPEDVEEPKEIITETIDISNLTESVIIPIQLVLPEGIIPTSEIETINAAVNIEPKEEQ